MNKEKLKELLNSISNIISLGRMFDFEDNTYFFKRVSKDDEWTTSKENWKQQKDSIYQLLKMDKNTYEELERYELYVKETKSRCGGYYTDYYYTYERSIVDKIKCESNHSESSRNDKKIDDLFDNFAINKDQEYMISFCDLKNLEINRFTSYYDVNKIKGEILNFIPSKQIVVKTDEGLYIILYNCILEMRPIIKD